MNRILLATMTAVVTLTSPVSLALDCSSLDTSEWNIEGGPSEEDPTGDIQNPKCEPGYVLLRKINNADGKIRKCAKQSCGTGSTLCTRKKSDGKTNENGYLEYYCASRKK